MRAGGELDAAADAVDGPQKWRVLGVSVFRCWCVEASALPWASVPLAA